MFFNAKESIIFVNFYSLFQLNCRLFVSKNIQFVFKKQNFNIFFVGKITVLPKKSKNYFGLFRKYKMQNNAKKVYFLVPKNSFRLFRKNELTKKQELFNKTVKKLYLRLKNEFLVITIRIVSTY